MDRLAHLSRRMRGWHAGDDPERRAARPAEALDARQDPPAELGAMPAHAAHRPVSGRFRATASQLGFSPPPVPLQLHLVKAHGRWTLVIQPQGPSPLALLVDWLAPWSPTRIEFGARNALRADFEPVPMQWAALFRNVAVDTLRLAPDGEAEAIVTGASADLAAFSHFISLSGRPVELRQLAEPAKQGELLTNAQGQALQAAVDAGYYRIPRSLNLRELAQRIGVSSTALSERLRRAEARVITRFVDANGKASRDAEARRDGARSAQRRLVAGSAARSPNGWSAWDAQIARGRSSAQILSALSDEEIAELLSDGPFERSVERRLLAREAIERVGVSRVGISKAATAAVEDLIRMREIAPKNLVDAAEEERLRDAASARSRASEMAAGGGAGPRP